MFVLRIKNSDQRNFSDNKSKRNKKMYTQTPERFKHIILCPNANMFLKSGPKKKRRMNYKHNC